LVRITQYKTAQLQNTSELTQLQSQYDSLLAQSQELTQKLGAVEDKNESSQSTLSRQAAVLNEQTQEYQEKLDDFTQKAQDLQSKLDELTKQKEEIIDQLNKIPYLPGIDTSDDDTAEPTSTNSSADPIESLDLKLTSLDATAANQLKQYNDLSQQFEQALPLLKDYPSIWPVSGIITSGFGWRQDPWGGNGSKYHSGMDIAVPTGTTVKAAGGGTVEFAGWNSGGYGYLVEIDHGNGLETLYGHNSKVLVSVGDTVVRGQAISLSGSTGDSTGPHVHYEVRVDGKAVDPTGYMALSGKTP
jgi:murein DD-endopeptidase MepM/ murein hydrolase activator NlpD